MVNFYVMESFLSQNAFILVIFLYCYGRIRVGLQALVAKSYKFGSWDIK